MKLRVAHRVATACMLCCVLLVRNACAVEPTSGTSTAAINKNQILAVDVRVDRTNCTVADRVVLEYIVDTPSEGVLTLPVFEASTDTLMNGWRVVRSLSRERIMPDTSGMPHKRTSMHVVLEPFLPGSKRVPEQRFVFQPAGGGRAVEVTSRAVDVQVDTVFSDTDQAGEHEPKPKGLRALTLQTTASDRLRAAYILAGCVIAAVFLTFGIVRVLRRPKPSPDPIHEAISTLEQLRDQGGMPSQIGSALRLAIAARGVPRAPNLTPDELIPEMSTKPWFMGQLQSDLPQLIRELAQHSYAPGFQNTSLSRVYAERAIEVAKVLQHLSREDAR